MSWDANGSPIEEEDLGKQVDELEAKLKMKYGGKWTMCHNIDDMFSKFERINKLLNEAIKELDL